MKKAGYETVDPALPQIFKQKNVHLYVGLEKRLKRYSVNIHHSIKSGWSSVLELEVIFGFSVSASLNFPNFL